MYDKIHYNKKKSKTNKKKNKAFEKWLAEAKNQYGDAHVGGLDTCAGEIQGQVVQIVAMLWVFALKSLRHQSKGKSKTLILKTR